MSRSHSMFKIDKKTGQKTDKGLHEEDSPPRDPHGYSLELIRRAIARGASKEWAIKTYGHHD